MSFFFFGNGPQTLFAHVKWRLTVQLILMSEHIFKERE